MDTPLVSIVCDVYNHGPFLRSAIDGFIMQQVNFPIEILIHDDASTDNSAEIIREYENRYPDLIRPIYETDNQYYKQNLWADIQFPRAKGKYIAICEGDDYWTDPLKLQKQIDFMEAHPDCSMCFGNSCVHWEDGSRPDQPLSAFATKAYPSKYLCSIWSQIATSTFVFKSHIVKSPLFDKVAHNPKMVVGDLPLFLMCASEGELYALSDMLSVYRRHHGGLTQRLNADELLKWGELWEEIPVLFGPDYTDVSVFWAIYNYRSGMRLALKEEDSVRYRLFRHRIRRLYFVHPVAAAKRLMRVMAEKL